MQDSGAATGFGSGISHGTEMDGRCRKVLRIPFIIGPYSNGFKPVRHLQAVIGMSGRCPCRINIGSKGLRDERPYRDGAGTFS